MDNRHEWIWALTEDEIGDIHDAYLALCRVGDDTKSADATWDPWIDQAQQALGVTLAQVAARRPEAYERLFPQRNQRGSVLRRLRNRVCRIRFP